MPISICANSINHNQILTVTVPGDWALVPLQRCVGSTGGRLPWRSDQDLRVRAGTINMRCGYAILLFYVCIYIYKWNYMYNTTIS